MKIFLKRNTRAILVSVVAGAVALAASSVHASEGGAEIKQQPWSFGGITGYYDQAQLRRGFLVYKNVCAACHGLRRVAFRNLGEPGGPEFSKEEVAAIAAEAQVTDGPNDEGQMFQRPGKPSDYFVPPYPNDKAAAAAQNGAVPPDLSLIAKARGITRNVAWFAEPYYWLHDIVTAYQEQGPDYIVGLMTGYTDPPTAQVPKEACGKAETHTENYIWDEASGQCKFNLTEGMNYNAVFPGHQIAMPPPLSDGQVDFAPGTEPQTKEACEATPDQIWDAAANKCTMTTARYAKDVAAFLMWTAEPKLEERKRLGLKVLIYLIILAGLVYLSKRALWRDVEH